MHMHSQTHRSHIDFFQSSRPRYSSFVMPSRRLVWGHLLWITGLNLRSNKFLSVYVVFCPACPPLWSAKIGVNLWSFYLMNYCYLPVTLWWGHPWCGLWVFICGEFVVVSVGMTSYCIQTSRDSWKHGVWTHTSWLCHAPNLDFVMEQSKRFWCAIFQHCEFADHLSQCSSEGKLKLKWR